MTQPASDRPPRRFRLLRRLLWALLVAALLDALYLAAIWPDFEALAQGAIPKSAYIEDYEQEAAEDPSLPPLRFAPVPLRAISPAMRRAVVVAEDARFYRHGGFDLGAIREAMEYNLEQGRFAIGASTLSQQTARNLFLSPARNPLRKWHEVVLTAVMERRLGKDRILELYLNVAELGRGIYGVEAAARAYFGVSAAALTREQAVALAACLPSPQLHNPATGSEQHRRRVQKIQRHLARAGW